MTVIIGIVCKSSILLASDSQTTFSDYSKRCDSEKIRVVEFGKDKVLVAQSGAVDTSSRVIDVMSRLASERTLASEEIVIKTAQEAMRQVRGELRYQNFDCTAEELDRLIALHDLDCSLMAAHFYDHKPFIHTFKFRMGTVETAKSNYESTGCGSALANYLLGELSSAEMTAQHAQAIAVYVVEKVIRHVAFCDRPVRLALVHPWKAGYVEENAIQPPDSKPKLPPVFIDSVNVLTSKEVEEIATKISKIDEETKLQRTEKLKSALFSYADTLPQLPSYTSLPLDYLKMPENPYSDLEK